MSRVCEICGKGKTIGNHVTTRGRAKHLKGVGTKVTGITRRDFKPNLQNVRVAQARVEELMAVVYKFRETL